jgi:hypothetical protein
MFRLAGKTLHFQYTHSIRGYKMSGLGSIAPEDRKKFEGFMTAGLRVMQEIDDLKGGLKDTTKALAEEYGILPRKLTTALRTAYKNTLADKKEEMDVVEEILNLTGHG